MPSPFDAALGAADPVFDAVGGEEWTLTPMLPAKAGRISPAPDPARQPVTLRGIRETTPVLAAHTLVSNGEETGRKPGHQGQSFRVSFALTALPWRPEPGFGVRRVETGETFTVSRILDEGATRLHLELTRA